jgi:Ca-activated chloride channel family protein
VLIVDFPWAALILPLPFVVRRLLPARRVVRPALHAPFLERLEAIVGDSARAGGGVSRPRIVQVAGLAAIWILLVAALARPRVVEAPITRSVPTRDLLLAVDLSGSMAAEDFRTPGGETSDRLTAVKRVLDDFLQRREGDRVGVVVFGTSAFVLMPFTEDLGACRELIAEMQISMAGPKTALGDAIGLAATLFERSETPQRVLIALTDGNDTASLVPPEKAAAIAKDRDVTIHTIAVGDATSVGEQAIDERVLEEVANTTGGQFFRAANPAELAAVYDRLDEIEVRELETVSHRPTRDVYAVPLALALLLGILMLARAGVRARRRPPSEVAHA